MMKEKKEGIMAQLHKRFTDDQVKAILRNYSEGQMCREEAQEILGISKSRFFFLLKAYRANPAHMKIEYIRKSPGRINPEEEQTIRQELKREKALVEDERLPITSYNYTALRDRLKNQGIEVSVPTIIKRAKEEECYKPRRKQKVHDRQVVTTAIGEMIQHDASTHLWSPLGMEKWTLITSLDDYSRMLLYADFVKSETSWAHIQAAQKVLVEKGLPVRYYVDNLRVFRFIQNRDSFWRNHILETDDVDPQWRQVMRLLNVGVTYALSPQAKGNSLFRPFTLPRPYTSLRDIFCLHDSRTLNGYRKISIAGQEYEIPKVDPRETVELHLYLVYPSLVEIRIWFNQKMVHSLTLPISKLKNVHFLSFPNNTLNIP